MPCRRGPLCRDDLSMKNGAILAWIAGTPKIGAPFDRSDRGPLARIRVTPPYAGDARRGEQPPERSDVLVLTRHRGIDAVSHAACGLQTARPDRPRGQLPM